MNDKVRKALEERNKRQQENQKDEEKKTSDSNKTRKSKINDALEARKQRITTTLPSTLDDLSKRYESVLNSHNNSVATPMWGRNATDIRNGQRENMLATTDLIRDFEAYRKYFGDDATDSILASLGEIKTSQLGIYDNAEIFSQYKTEKEYNAAYKEYQRQQEEDNKLLSYDLKAGADEIASYQAVQDEMRSLMISISDMKDVRNAGKYTQADIAAADARYKELEQKYGYWDELNNLIEEKEAYYNKAEKRQKHKQQEDYYEQFRLSPDFEEKSKYASTYRGGEVFSAVAGMYTDTGFDDIEYDAINRNETARDRIRLEDLKSGSAFLGYDKSYLYEMTDEEIALYNSLYDPNDKTASDEYLRFLLSDLNYRRRDTQQQQWAQMAKEDPVGTSIASILMAPSKSFTAIGQVVDYVSDGAIDQNAGYNKFSHIPSSIRGQVASDIAESGNWGEVGSWTYQLGMSMGDFLMTTAASGGNKYLSLALMGSGAMADTVIASKDRGLSDDQAFTLGVVAGAAEIITEKFSLDALFDVGADQGAIKYILKNAFVEGTEEVSSSVINLAADVLISKEKSEWAMAIQRYLDENPGATESEAFQKVLQDEMMSLGLDFLGGTIMGGSMGTGGAVINTVAQNAQYRADGSFIMGVDGGTDALMNLANEVAGVSGSKKLSNQIHKTTNKTTEKNVGKLFNAIQSSNSSMNQADIAKSLVRKGIDSQKASSIAEALVASYNGKELTGKQERLMRSMKDNQAVKDAVSNIMENPESTMGKRNQNVKKFATDIALEMLAKESGTDLNAIKNATDGNVTTADEIASESSYEVSEDGKTVNNVTGEEIELNGLVKAEDGTYMIAAKNADAMSSDDVSYKDKNQALVYETFVNLEKYSGKTSDVIAGMSLDSRNELIGLYNPNINKDGGTFVNGVLDAYFYGHQGVDMATASKDSPMYALSPEQRAIAWNTGRADGIKSTTAAQSNVDTVYAEAKKVLDSGKAKKGSYRAILADGIAMEHLNDKQQAAYQLADQIAQAVQTKIRVYNGVTKEQGFYKYATDEIWLNLNAANVGREAIMAFTLAHELVHRAKTGSPDKYQAFVDFLMKEYGKQGSNIEAMIAEQIDAAERFNKTVPDSQKVKMTREKALEEVVCDACQRMLLDTNAGQKLAEFGAQSKQNKGFLADLKQWISELMVKLRNFFKNVEPGSKAAKEFAKFDANVKQILADMYVDMSMEAGEKLSTIKAAYGTEFAQKLQGLRDISYNLAAVDTHKTNLQNGYSEDSSTDLDTIMKRYDKIIDIWTRLGGELNSKFLADWNSKVRRKGDFTIFKAQAGYKYNVELSSMCKKGVPLFEAIDTIVKKEVMKELEIDVLGKAEKEILYDILKQHHFEIPCAICYVEQARQREGVIIDAFLNGKVETDSKGRTTKVKLGWNQVLDSIEKEMKANGVNYSFAQVSRDIATEKYTPANMDMDSKTHEAFLAALKKVANQEITRYNKAKGKSRKLLTDVTPAAVTECFKGTLPANLKIFKVLFEEPSSRFKFQKDLLYSSLATQNLSMLHNKLYGLFNSQGGVSGYKTKQGTTIYWGDILGKRWKPDTLRNEGGVRNQSNSDFQMYTLLDQAQMYLDFTTKGYYLQAYTKVLSELKLFGLSRGKINASLIPKVVVYRNADGSVDVEKTMANAGLDENDNPIYDDIEGINHNEAFMLIEDPEYSKSICGICIGYSDAHINKLLDDNRVQQIIGFHDKTDDGTKRYKGARYAKNYNGLNEAVNKEGKTVHIGFNTYVKRAEKKFQFNADTETYEGTVNYNGKTYTADDIPRLAADLYLEMCAKKEYTPAYKDFAGHTNYYKLLADFGLYDSQGHYAPHRKVVYNMPDTVPYLDANGKKQTMSTYDYIKAELTKELTVRDSIAEALADTSDEGIIPQFKEAVKKSQEEKSYSLPKIDSEGNQLSEEQQEFFKDSKVRDANGNLLVVYHGTPNGNTTIFDKAKTSKINDMGQGIYFSTNKSDASTYMGKSRNKKLYSAYVNIKAPFVVSDDVKITVSEAANLLKLCDDRMMASDVYREIKINAKDGYITTSQLANTNISQSITEILEKSGKYDGIIDETVSVKFGLEKGTKHIITLSSNQIKSINNQNPTTDPDIRYSLPKGPYSYETLIRKPDMVVTTVGGNVPNNRADVAHMAKKNATKVGKFDPKTGSVSVRVEDIDTDVILSTKGLRHSLRRTQDPLNEPNYIVTVKAGEILKNSIRINEITPEDENANSSYVLIGVAKDANGTYVVRFVVNHFDNNVTAMDVLYAINAKKELAVLNAPRLTAEPLSVTSSTISIEELLDLVNKYFPDILPEEVLKHYGYDSRPDGDLGDDALYKLPVGEDTSPRALLANAFEGIVTDDIENRRLQEYKGKVEMLNAEEQKLRELRAEIKELSFAKGKRDTKRIKDLQFDAIKTVNRISNLDKTLLRLEAATPLQNILKREKEMAYKRAEQKGKEALETYRKAERERDAKWQSEVKEKYQASKKKAAESRSRTALRHKIKDFRAKLERTLLKPTDRQYVPIDLIKAMVEVCELIDTDTSLYKAYGEINKAQERRNLTKEKLQALKDEYEKLKTHSDPIYAGEFDEMVYTYLTELRDKYSGKHLNDMSLDELMEMYEILRAIDETLRDARKLIGWGDADNVYEAGDAIVSEQKEITQSRKNGKRNIFQKTNDSTLNLSLSPVRNVERMSGYNGDSYLLKLFKKFEQGIRKKNKFMMDAYKSFESLTSGKEYDDAMYTEVGGKKYEDVNGRKFGVSKMQMMQAILSYERETANGLNHIQGSGFSFADLTMLRKGKLKDAVSEEYSHRVPAAVELVAEFTEALKNDKWCQDYMAAARKFFNGTAKDAINETSIAMKHRIIAKEKSYIPYEVDKNFVVREISAENEIQQTINSYGMLKETKKGASQPLIITGLNNILDRHIDQVGNVYGLAIEVRNFNKVWNVRSVDEVGNDPTVKTAIQRNWGVEGVKHIEQAVKDIQGRRIRERSALYDKVKSGYIGATFLLNLSVVTKQIGSLFSATSMLRWRDPARQVGNLVYTMINHKKIAAEVDKYTASAWMRRQGLSDAEVHTLITQSKKPGLFRLLSKAPAIINPTKWITAMDHAVALSLWKYAKIDTAKRTGLKGEALLEATAEFYDEVIENTQSMTDVLHRPEIQKRGDVISEAFGMFKTDLYQMAGQLHTTTGRFMANRTKENAKALSRTVYSIAMNAVWGQLMTTVFALLRYKVKPYRDEEDEELTAESWLKRQGFSFAGDLLGYIFPIFGSEIVGVFENIMYGESEDIVDSLALTAINDLYDTMITVGTSIKDGEMPEPADMKKLTAKALQVFGIPANNILRTWEAIQLHAKDIANGEFLSFEAGVDRSPKHHIHRIIEAVDTGKTDVAIGLFEEAIEEEAMGKSDDGSYGEDELNEARSSLQTALGDKYKDGEVSKETARKILSEVFGKSEEEIYWIFDQWDYSKENGSSDDYAKYSEFFTAVETGKNLKAVITKYTDNGVSVETLASQITSHYKPLYIEMSTAEKANIKGYILNAMTVLGKTREEAERTVSKWEFESKYGFAYDDRAEAYKTGKISASELKNILMTVGGKTAEEADLQIQAYDWEEQGYDGVTAAAVRDYNNYCAGYSVPKDVYLHIRSFANNTKNDVDSSGKTINYSAMKKIMAEINSQYRLTSSQKTAIARSLGWSEKNIQKYKLW